MRKSWLKIFLLSAISFTGNAQLSKDSLLNVISAKNNDVEELRAYVRLASEYMRTDIPRAKAFCYQALFLSHQINDFYLRSSLFSLLTTAHTNTANTDSAQFYLHLLKELSLKHPDQIKIQANYYSTAGLYNKRQGNYKDALPLMIRAANITYKQNDTENTAGQYLNIGNTYMLIGDYKNALGYHLQALKLFESIDNKRGISFCFQNISNDFVALKQYKKALGYAQQSLRLKQNLKDTRGIGTAYRALGKIYAGILQHDKALDYYSKALKLSQDMQVKTEEAQIHIDIANLYSNYNKPEKAKEYYQQGIDIAKTTGDTAALVLAETELMQLQANLVKEKEKETTLIKNLNNVIRRGDKNDEVDFYKHLSDHYELNNDFLKALEYNKIYYFKKDSLANAQLQYEINQLEEQYKNELKENEIALLKKDQMLNNVKLQKQKSLQYGTVALLGLIVIIALLLFHRYRFINRNNRLLEMVKVRNNIAKDLHDDIGSTLSSINIMSGVMFKQAENGVIDAKGLKKIKENSAAIMESMSDIVWAVNPQNDTVDKIIYKMKEFASELLDPLNIQFSFIEKGNLASLQLDAQKRKDLYMVFKETINNAAKYSYCKNIEIILQYDGQSLQLEIKDDGKGFDLLHVKKGNGLKNMDERIRSMDGSLQYTTKEGAGTFIHMEVPVT
jgi:two-component system, NarL family, sensor histidine kinase UhpB